jgi:replication factor A1
MSLNINQSSRIAVLREGTRPVVAPGEPVDIAALPNDGYACIVGRLMSSRADQIHRRDGSGSIDVVRGRLADESGAIGFLSWEPFDYEIGTLLKIDGAQVKTFRDTPELNFGRTTKIEPFHDATFADSDALKEGMVSTISTLRDGSKDVEIVVNITSWEKRSFTKDGEERYLWSGQIADPTGQCRVSAWTDLPIDDSSLPLTVRITDARVRAWQGIPDITIDREDQLTILEETPWEGELDLENLKIEVPLTELVSGPSRVGISTRGTIVSVREDSGTIMRCPECRRVLREGQCFEHGAVEGNEDVRLRLVLDDKAATCALLISKDAALALLKTDHATMVDEIQANGPMAYVQSIRDKLLGCEVDVTGRVINDGQGAMILSDGATLTESDTGMIATELRAQWGLQ